MTEAAKKRMGWALGVALAILAAVGIGVLVDGHSTAQQARPPGSPPLVPVGAARVTRQDVPIYLNGLGSVQAFSRSWCVRASTAR